MRPSHACFSDPYNPHLFVLTGNAYRRQRGNLRGFRPWAWPPTCVVQHDGDGSLSVLVLAVAALPLVGFLMESAPPPLPQGSNRTPVTHRDWARPSTNLAHIPDQDWARVSHGGCTRAGLAPPTSAPGLGAPPPTSAPGLGSLVSPTAAPGPVSLSAHTSVAPVRCAGKRSRTCSLKLHARTQAHTQAQVATTVAPRLPWGSRGNGPYTPCPRSAAGGDACDGAGRDTKHVRAAFGSFGL
jgi:hypothetical protein